MRISDWSSDVCSSDLREHRACLADRVGSLHVAEEGLAGIEVVGLRQPAQYPVNRRIGRQGGGRRRRVGGIAVVDEEYAVSFRYPLHAVRKYRIGFEAPGNGFIVDAESPRPGYRRRDNLSMVGPLQRGQGRLVLDVGGGNENTLAGIGRES